MNKSDALFYGIFFGCAGILFSLWYFLNPNSPYFNKVEYTIVCESIHTLKENNLVTVNGLKKGHVKSLREENGSILVVVIVDESVTIPIDSKVLIRNFGLMGERVIEILQGDSQENYPVGARIIGSSDKGTSELVMQATVLINESVTIISTMQTLFDSVLYSEETQKTMESVMGKLKKVLSKSERLIETHGERLKMIGQSADDAYEKVTVLSDAFDGAQTKKELKDLVKGAKAIVSELSDIMGVIEQQMKSIEEQNNSVGKIMYDPDFKKQVTQLQETFFKAKEVIKEQELRLNVDF